MESSSRDLSFDMVRFIFKNNQIKLSPCFTLPGVRLIEIGISFYCVYWVIHFFKLPLKCRFYIRPKRNNYSKMPILPVWTHTLSISVSEFQSFFFFFVSSNLRELLDGISGEAVQHIRWAIKKTACKRRPKMRGPFKQYLICGGLLIRWRDRLTLVIFRLPQLQ